MDRLSSELAEVSGAMHVETFPFWRAESHENAQRIIADAVEQYGQDLRAAIERDARKLGAITDVAPDVQNGPNER